MTLQEMKQKLREAFGKYEFVEYGHYYLCNGKKVGISTTRLIHQYTNEFDSDTISQRIADKRGITQSEVLEEWRIENLHSTIKGNRLHEYSQGLWEKRSYPLLNFSEVPDGIDKNRLGKELLNGKKQADKFYNDFRHKLTLIGCEIYLGDEESDECGAADIVFYNNYTGGLVVVDFKTNKTIERDNQYNKFMKVPLSHLPDTNYTHYSLQLCDYSYKITKNTGIPVEDKFIVYFDVNQDTYEIIEVLKVEKEIKKILENRRVRNLKSVPILIYGKSGTGKSTSLRNFNDDEVGVINVLGKPLPFKNKLKTANTDSYESILKAITETQKKIIVIDDAGYLLTNEFMRTSSVKGYDKFNTMANNFWNLIEAIKQLDGGKTVYMIMHEETNDNGDVAPRTIGKMLNDKVCVEGMFTIALRSMYENDSYIFRTKTNGQDVTKAPLDMFDVDYVENDLKEVDKVIREYYELDKKEKGEDK